MDFSFHDHWNWLLNSSAFQSVGTVHPFSGVKWLQHVWLPSFRMHGTSTLYVYNHETYIETLATLHYCNYYWYCSWKPDGIKLVYFKLHTCLCLAWTNCPCLCLWCGKEEVYLIITWQQISWAEILFFAVLKTYKLQLFY